MTRRAVVGLDDQRLVDRLRIRVDVLRRDHHRRLAGRVVAARRDDRHDRQPRTRHPAAGLGWLLERRCGRWAQSGRPLLGAGANPAVKLDGVDDRLDFGDYFDFSSKASFSIELWVKLGALTTTYGRLAAKVAADSGGWQIGFNGSPSSYAGYVFFIRSDGTAGPPQIGSNSPLVVGAWTHIVGTYDGSTMKLYRDGLLNQSMASSVSLPDSTAAMTIGSMGPRTTPTGPSTKWRCTPRPERAPGSSALLRGARRQVTRQVTRQRPRTEASTIDR
jgi:hypothetical protein